MRLTPWLHMCIGGLVALGSSALLAATACPPPGYSVESLRTLKAQKFVVPDAAQRASLALALQACLADPNPELRDGIAFEAYQQWMRAKLLPTETLRSLSADLQAQLPNTAPDAAGYGKPFAALVLADVARTDRIAPWMTPAERQQSLSAATDYLTAQRDYRGFEDTSGWRHGVAHTADWLMQWALNPALDKAQLDLLLQAIASQVPAHGGHAYVFGEPERLAAPVLHTARRKLHTPQEWYDWLARTSALPAGAKAADVFQSQALLAWRHNVQAFLQALYVNVALGSDEDLKARLLPGLGDALKRLP